MNALYYCYACGLRLKAEEVDISVKRGETHATACCEKCAAAGKRIKDPKAHEAEALSATAHGGSGSTINASNPIPDDSAVLAAQVEPVSAPRKPNSKPPSAINIPGASQAARAARKTTIARSPALATSETRRTEKGGFPLLPVLGGMALLLVAAFLSFKGSSDSEAHSAGSGEAPRKRAAAPEPLAAPKAAAPVAAPAVTAPVSAPASSQTPPQAEAATTQPNANKDDLTIEHVEAFLRYKNFLRAREHLELLEKKVAQDAKFADVRTKLPALNTDIQNGSQAALDALLKAAEAKAEAGDLNGVRAVLGPQRLMDLLPEHAEIAAREADKFRDTANSVAKVADEKKQAELAASRAELEKNLPASLGPAPKATVLFGPDGWNTKATIKDGKEAIRKVPEKTRFLNGARAVVEFNGLLGVVTNDPIVIEYSAAQDTELTLWMELPEFGKRLAVVKLSAGTNQVLELNPNDDSGTFVKGKKGKATGRTIMGLGLEAKKSPPGLIAIFRISR
ncbi:MAG TPA: hypothetical protein VEK08_04925 [Planctomycetota bacterium]|nr:hypothetical protein [Planctomycetota bacterium]